MKIDFRELRNETEPSVRHERVVLQGVSEELNHIDNLSSIDTTVEASLVHHVCKVQGELKFGVTYLCSRCLDSFERHQQTGFNELFTDVLEKVDDDVHFAASGVVELDAYIEQSVHLAFEFFPVCSKDCKGLCSVCGGNLNVQTCGCDTTSVDPRLEALADLLSEDESE